MHGNGGEGAEEDDLHDSDPTRECACAGGDGENRGERAEGDAVIPDRHHAHLRKRPQRDCHKRDGRGAHSRKKALHDPG